MELDIEEQTLITTFRALNELGKKEVLRYASRQHKTEAESTLVFSTGQCKLVRSEERPETVAEPIFTE